MSKVGAKLAHLKFNKCFNSSLICTLNSYLISDKTIIIKTGKSYTEISVIEKYTGEPPKENHIMKPAACVSPLASGTYTIYLPH